MDQAIPTTQPTPSMNSTTPTMPIGTPIDPSSASCSTSPSQFVPRPTTTTTSFLPEFWSHVIRYAEEYHSDFKDCQLPLARIKKLVKSDPDIKMIANEVTVLLDKACEIFINDITVRAFLVANSLNRRTINTPDVVMALSQSDMFDFLIDIVPAEPHASAESASTSNKTPATTSSTSTLPTTATSSATTKKRRQTLPETPDPSCQVESNSSAATPQALPPPAVKRKRQNNKVNRNLLPEEVAVPISDTELIKKDRSPQFSSLNTNCSSDGRLLAVPIADSELIPPQSSEPPWELAIPVSSHDEASLPFAPPAQRSWEMAVPIPNSPSQLTARNWEVAVPIIDSAPFGNLNGRPNQKAAGRLRNWDLAVPIGEEQTNEDAFLASEDKAVMALDGGGQRSWELAVPISDQPSTTSERLDQIEFDRLGERTSHDRNPRSRSIADPVPEVPIDPSLSHLTSFVKLEADVNHPFPPSAGTDNHPVHPSGNGSGPFIKQEEL